MSFTSFDPDVVALDTGVATTPAARPSAFSPAGAPLAPAPPLTVDTGTATQVAARPNTVDLTIATVDTPDPGY